MQKILVVFEWQHEVHKIRIEIDSDVKRKDLMQAIISYLNQDDHLQLNESDIAIEIYHPVVGFQTLMNEDEIENIVEIFGKRIRCIVHDKRIGASAGQRKEETLLIKGRFFEYDPNGMEFAGKNLIIKEDCNNREEDGTGLNVWDGSLLLARYLERNQKLVQNKNVLELGCGPAVAGISAAVLGASEVILSDLEYSLPLVRQNVEINHQSIHESGCQKVHCMEIDWFNPPEVDSISSISQQKDKAFPQVILIADCVWLDELVNPLMNTVEKLSDLDTSILITYQRRGKKAHDIFWGRMKEIFSSIVEIDTKKDCNIEKPESIFLYMCHK
ncbi:hypothetical protein CTEN210_01782 [Chaetoceros tenuissimus]|uniref:Calmodulin-lysine N-methyltransferase n=1 Tax=Chaetoceros tenuissimus TaxID=426638 RepID=A0AAD3CGA9_9STRA|nr:hypothetical protein CTEN210_01782 [Chaetoceros tenuissimus]